MFATSIMPSKHAGSIKFDVKRLEKKLFLCLDCRRIEINLIIAILKHTRNKNKQETRSFATRENTSFGVHSVK